MLAHSYMQEDSEPSGKNQGPQLVTSVKQLREHVAQHNMELTRCLRVKQEHQMAAAVMTKDCYHACGPL